MSEEIIFVYETKCRKCDTIEVWYGGVEDERSTAKQFHSYMYEKMLGPTSCHCKNCDLDTIQDHISFGKMKKNDPKIYPVLTRFETPTDPQ